MLATILGILLMVAPQSAQANMGKFRGVVRDSSKAPLPGVPVTIINRDTKASYKVVSSVSGEYRFDVPAGKYDLKAELPGFQLLTKSNIEIKESDSASIDLLLIPGDYLPGQPLPPGFVQLKENRDSTGLPNEK